MGICANEFREYVVQPTLKDIDFPSLFAENLLLGTAAVESDLGSHLHLADHASLGIYQISPTTHRKIWDTFLYNRHDLASKVRGLASQREFLLRPHAELATNLSYSTAIALMVYLSTKKNFDELAANNPQVLADTWLQYFKSEQSESNGSSERFIESYNHLILKKKVVA
ncbi:MAG: hypothetical protein KAG53_10930 [Endozoicomonadaceae bacterium]|nr:hypothetical protein [Endozoicomonadaceae bacterium]